MVETVGGQERDRKLLRPADEVPGRRGREVMGLHQLEDAL
jgi:hypothetical protein